MKTQNGRKKAESLLGSNGRESAQSGSDPAEMQPHIAMRAYELYRERGCHDGQALDDWLKAEREILSRSPTL